MSIVLVLQALKVRAWSVQNESLVSSPLAGEQIMRIEAAVVLLLASRWPEIAETTRIAHDIAGSATDDE